MLYGIIFSMNCLDYSFGKDGDFFSMDGLFFILDFDGLIPVYLVI